MCLRGGSTDGNKSGENRSRRNTHAKVVEKRSERRKDIKKEM